MSPPDLTELAQLQRGFLALATGRGARSHAARTALAEIDAPDAREAVSVYRRMYALRMAREVAREFPATRALLGAAAFDRVARAYAATRRSRSFTLEGYAAGLPAYLRRTRMHRDAAALAELERALARAQSAPCATARLDAPLTPAGGAELLRFPADVERAYARFAGGQLIRKLRARATWLAIYRRVGRARRIRIAPREVALLRALLAGRDLERAVARATASGLGPASIRRALERWVGAGLFSARYRTAPGSIQAPRCPDSTRA